MSFVVEGLSFERAGRPILRDVSFALSPGERVVILGVNGCGKTTLLKLLDGLLYPTAGRILWNGEVLEARRLDDDGFRRRFRGAVGLLFQSVDAMLFCPSVADELAFGPRQLGLADVDARVATWARQLDLGELLDRPPFELSGGEKKRVALAALFAVGPRDLLLDEPTAGLDPAAAARLVDFLNGLAGVTVVTSTHNLGVAEELGTRAILLAPGHAGVLYDGPTAGLVHDEALLAESGLAHRHGHAPYHVHDLE